MKNAELVSVALDIGENMLRCGAEVSRVEDSITRICQSYGAGRVDVFTITSSILVTVQCEDGECVTQTRRIRGYSTDFTKLDHLNTLSRTICKTQPGIQEVHQQIEKVLKTESEPQLYKYLGGMLGASAFCVFFGGTLFDAFVVAMLAIMEIGLEIKSRMRKLNQVAYYFFISLLSGSLSIFLVKLGIGQQVDKIMIGSIMLLIPGLALTNAIRDMLSGDIISGLLRLCESLLVAASIACGFAVAILLFQNVGEAQSAVTAPWIGIVSAFLGSLGFALFFKDTGKKLWIAAIGGGLTWILYTILEQYGMAYFTNNFLCAVFSALYAEVMARRLKAPATVFLIPAVVPLIPGGGLYYTMSYAVGKNVDHFAGKGIETFSVAVAIAVGLVLISLVFKLYGGVADVYRRK